LHFLPSRYSFIIAITLLVHQRRNEQPGVELP
jgi:hypothetical protein